MLRYLFVYSTYNKISSLFPNYNVNPFHFQIRSSSDMSIFTHCRRLSYINLRYLNKNGSDSVRPLLELNNISYSYHTIDGENKSFIRYFFSACPRRICRRCRTFRMWEIHTSFVNRRTYRGRERNNLPRRRTIGKIFQKICQNRLYASA